MGIAGIDTARSAVRSTPQHFERTSCQQGEPRALLHAAPWHRIVSRLLRLRRSPVAGVFLVGDSLPVALIIRCQHVNS